MKRDSVKVFQFFLLIISLSLLLSLLQISCTKKEEKTEKKAPSPKIYTTLYAFEHFTKILLPEAEVESLIPPGADPHHFEPSLKDIQKLNQASLIVYLGDTDVDRWVDKLSKELYQKGVRLLKIQDRFALKTYSSSKELDPHVWLDPDSVLEIIGILRDELIKVASERKGEIEKNYTIYDGKIKELSSSYRETLSKCQIKDIITTHEFLNYLGRRYGFSVHHIVHEPEQEPSLKRVKQLRDIMKKNSIEYIVSEPEGERIAKALSKETGAKILNFDTFHTKSDRDYYTAMKDNLKVLAEALRCQK